jgi:membrane protein YdbS with pleckstrin-like domain
VEVPSNKLDRRVLTLWWLTAGASAVVIVVGASIGVPVAELPVAISVIVSAAVVIAAGVGPYLRYRRWRYEIRERDLLLSRGALFHVVTLIPFDRIQFVETHQGPLDRLFRLTSLVVYTAAGRAGQIPGLDVSEAEELREELSKVVGAQTV